MEYYGLLTPEKFKASLRDFPHFADFITFISEHIQFYIGQDWQISSLHYSGQSEEIPRIVVVETGAFYPDIQLELTDNAGQVLQFIVHLNPHREIILTTREEEEFERSKLIWAINAYQLLHDIGNQHGNPQLRQIRRALAARYIFTYGDEAMFEKLYDYLTIEEMLELCDHFNLMEEKMKLIRYNFAHKAGKNEQLVL